MAKSSRNLPTNPKKGGGSKSTRALDLAVLDGSVADNVISRIQQALVNVDLTKLSETGSARFQYLKDYVWSKYADALPGEAYFPPNVRVQSAIEKWQVTEQRNAVTNCRLASGKLVTFRTCKNGKTAKYCRSFTSADVVTRTQKIVKSVLGERPPHISRVQGMFTNGASTRVKRSVSSVAEKFEGRPHATALAASFWSGQAFANPGWGRLNPTGFETEAVIGSVMFTVPKNSKIDRVACKEPEINAYLQRGYGVFIRNRLLKHGIDLLDQSRNQQLSRLAYSRGLATIDLSAASDSITHQLVKTMLPVEWYEELNSVRSHIVLTPSNGAIGHHMEMFSSMGNGFTFELESLLFWALTRAISSLIHAKGTISVYGDDIICPLATGRLLPRVFAFFGFTVNVEKSCTSGPFRESCGAHWYYGVDVKPFFVRRKPTTLVELIQLGNQLMAWITREIDLADVPTSLFDLWSFLAKQIEPRFYGGQSYERSDALVTGHMPREILRRKLKTQEVPQLGAYLAWHHSKLVTKDVTSPSEAFREVGWVVRPNLSWYDRDVMWLAQQAVLHGLGT